MTTQREETDSPSPLPYRWVGLMLLFAGALYAQGNSTAQQEAVQPAYLEGTLWVIALTLATAFFAMAESALRALHSARVRELVEEGVSNARLLERLVSHADRSIATAQAGMTLSSLLAAVVAVTTLSQGVARLLQPLATSGAWQVATDTGGMLIVTLLVALLVLAMGMVVPRTLAEKHAEKVALRLAKPLWGCVWLLSPFVAAAVALSNALLRPFRLRAEFSPRVLTPEEIISLVDAGEEQGVIEEEEREMIQSVLEFPDTIVRKVMTPRIDMHCVPVEASLQEVLDIIRNTGHSRIPVYEGTVDNIIGVVYAKDLLKLYPHLEEFDLRRVMRPPYFIPETKKVDELMREFRTKKTQIAIVRDEYGGTSGLVTLEDILEELVGEIHDEYDVEETPFEQLDNHTYRADGRTPVEDVNDKTGLHLPTDEYDTIGGFVFGLLGRPAQAGEQIAYGRANFIVEEADGRRIRKLRIEVAPAEPEEEVEEQPQESTL
ncbi:MAG: hemolysin family protein [Armatimonadota bacterium]|nr:hemolysin family protein [bacterium]MCS7309048.1 hemolysin family protein [Armatimonadota bacterium]MDW8103811.1 hemolysin family protein [Armatimonadota bacterium]MDW8289403.1 hemolysin family protein [Armatimonadota bacterium]